MHVLSIHACSCLHSCWFVSVDIYVFIGVGLHICGCIHVGVCTYIYVWSMSVSVCLHVCGRVAMRVPMCRSKNFFTHVYICVCVHVGACMHVPICVLVHTYLYSMSIVAIVLKVYVCD